MPLTKEVMLVDPIIISRAAMGLCACQVCVRPDVSDEEILAYVNMHNVAGTADGWTTVVRGTAHEDAPVECAEYPGRLHLVVMC
jgi:hypothetical protein